MDFADDLGLMKAAVVEENSSDWVFNLWVEVDEDEGGKIYGGGEGIV